MQQQSGDAQFGQQTGKDFKRTFEEKKDRKTGKNTWHLLHRKTCNCKESCKRMLFRICLRNLQLCLLDTEENAESEQSSHSLKSLQNWYILKIYLIHDLIT